jgi:hypothetical protein
MAQKLDKEVERWRWKCASREIDFCAPKIIGDIILRDHFDAVNVEQPLSVETNQKNIVLVNKLIQILKEQYEYTAAAADMAGVPDGFFYKKFVRVKDVESVCIVPDAFRLKRPDGGIVDITKAGDERGNYYHSYDWTTNSVFPVSYEIDDLLELGVSERVF